MKAVLGALALLLVVGCSGDGPAPTNEPARSSTPSASATAEQQRPPRPPRQRLRAAQRILRTTAQGAYTLRVDTAFTDTAIVERAEFDVPKQVVNGRRVVRFRDDGGKARYVIRIRSSPGSRFLQLEDWGRWDGCWAEFTPDLLAEQGIDLTGVTNVPAPVYLVLKARLSPENITPTSGPMARRATVLTDGFTALQLLGFSGAALLDLPLAVGRVKVPVQLTYFADYPNVVETIELYGNEVADALREGKSRTTPELRRFVDQRDATVTFSPAARPVRFRRPPPRKLVPPGATEDQTCAAHTPPAQNITVENVVVWRKPTRA